jgi:hypothetical protein
MTNLNTIAPNQLGNHAHAVMGAWIEAHRYRSALVHFPHSGDSY